MVDVEFADGSVGQIKSSVFDWICRIGESAYRPEYWKWIESGKHEKLVVKMNRFTWHIYLSKSASEVLQKNNGELYCAVTRDEFTTIKECTNALVGVH